MTGVSPSGPVGATASEDHAHRERAGHLHHVEVAASDLDAAVDVWGWLLGELGYEPGDATVVYGDRHPYARGCFALYSEDPEGVEVVGPAEDARPRGRLLVPSGATSTARDGGGC